MYFDAHYTFFFLDKSNPIIFCYLLCDAREAAAPRRMPGIRATCFLDWQLITQTFPVEIVYTGSIKRELFSFLSYTPIL